MCTSTGDSVTKEFVSVDQNIAQIVVQAELQERIAGTCDRPSVFVMVINDQAARFGCCLEFAVVVGIAAATVLNAANVIVVVYHLMQQRGGNFLDGAR